MFARSRLAQVALLVTLGLASTVHAQAFITTPGNQVYEFTGTSTGDNQFNLISAQPLAATFSTYTRNNVNWATFPDVFNSSQWSLVSTINLTKYTTFTLTPRPGFELQLQSLGFDVARNANGPQNGEVRFSTDGFASVGGSFSFSPNLTTSINLWNFINISTSSPVEFRFYGWNASVGGGQMRFDNVYVTGGAFPVPEPLGILGVTFGSLAVAGWIRSGKTRSQAELNPAVPS